MPMLQTFKQTVLDLGRGEAKTKARPLTVGDETLDRSAAGLDHRLSERAAMFWLLSDRALFLVVGSDTEDHAYRVPYESVAEMALDFDETADFLPWYVRVSIDPEVGEITRLEPGTAPGQPLGALPPAEVTGDARARLVRGETIPLQGFAATSRRFRGALERRMELARSQLSITGAEAAERKALLMRRTKGREDSE
ncbi:MAG: hypothetical protein QNJ71_03605 [Acidimicrobiia bacterium]|nr:hypothetical protein [Acidimicrobiia bacterium]